MQSGAQVEAFRTLPQGCAPRGWPILAPSNSRHKDTLSWRRDKMRSSAFSGVAPSSRPRHTLPNFCHAFQPGPLTDDLSLYHHLHDTRPHDHSRLLDTPLSHHELDHRCVSIVCPWACARAHVHGRECMPVHDMVRTFPLQSRILLTSILGLR